jgi:hypothetical protein
VTRLFVASKNVRTPMPIEFYHAESSRPRTSWCPSTVPPAGAQKKSTGPAEGSFDSPTISDAMKRAIGQAQDGITPEEAWPPARKSSGINSTCSPAWRPKRRPSRPV